jgi:hypothetical protein
MRKIGKGTGIRAPILRAQARELMQRCQTAVPVWIMPLSQVVESFDPRYNRFDVIIIDEASQADIKALTAIYMGKQIVIVDDDEQVTPMDVGQKLERVDKLIAEHLQGIPLTKNYDGRLSIYDLAKTFELVCLQEHFRCVAPIIQFSNTLSCDGKIKPLRDDSNTQRRPATIEYPVANASEAANQVNAQEAQVIVSLLVAAREQSEYQAATFGVISMVSEKLEEDMARQMILERLGWRFVCIRGSHFFRNPDQAMAPVFTRLRELEIPPLSTTSERTVTNDEKKLRDRIERRAAELRIKWTTKEKNT